jgi:Zn-dependent protease with chaperone function
LIKYEAIYIDSQTSSQRKSGLIFFTEKSFSFVSEDINYEIPFHLITISSGGSGNKLVFFNNAENENISVYTSDRSVYKNEYLKNHENLALQLKSSKKISRNILYGTVFVISLFILSIIGLIFSKDFIVEKIANQAPVSWEKTVGDKLFQTISLQYKFIHNDSLKNEFLKVAKPLTNQLKKEGVKIDLYFIKDPSINAFALPGGKVVIQSGLIDNAESWEEVMGVLSHELAHVIRRHHLRGIINNIGIYTLLSALIGDVTAIAGTVLNTGGELASLSNSRDFETEADETGWDYLEKAKINPKGMISFFETLDKESGSKLDGYLSFMSTHPETKERIKNLKKKLKEHPTNFPLISNNFDQFKKSFNKQK